MDTPLNNLPLQLTSFVGREREIAEVKRLLASTRLLTLTGAGGAGKTRLALRVAMDLTRQYPNGAWFIDLAPLTDSTLVPQAIASVFDLRESPETPLISILSNYLRARNLLLVLDNCEHLIEACAQLADTLLRACPHLIILATSREALGIAGEFSFRVPSLLLPDSADARIELIAQCEAIKLFIERAMAATYDFKLTDQNASTIAQICQRLDGMPLAIELAAARVRSISVEQIAMRLASHDRFRLLTIGSRTAPTRQQTLRAAIDWSYDLLSESERELFRQLAVFTGGWTLEAAEQVCRGHSTVVDTLTSLVDKSLIVIEQKDSDVRYRFLETIRQYAHEKLVESKSLENVRNRHLNYFLKLAEEAEPKLKGAEQTAWAVRLEKEYDNLRAAWEWAIETDAEMALQLAWSLLEFWAMGWHLPEARDWLARLVPQTGGWGESAKRARTLILAGALANYQRDYVVARELTDQGLAIAERNESEFEIALAYKELGASSFFAGDFKKARSWLEASLVLWREFGNAFNIAHEQCCLANVTRDQGEFALAHRLYEESLEKFQELGNNRHVAGVFNSMGVLAGLQGDYPRAAKLYEQCIRLERENRGKDMLAMAVGNLGFVLLRAGDYLNARKYFEELLSLEREFGRKDAICLSLVGLAGVIGATHKPEHAVRILGLIEATINDSDIILQRTDRMDYDYVWASVRDRLDQATFEKALIDGRKMTLEQAVEYALSEQMIITASPITLSHAPNALTPREVEVLQLVANGLSDAQIAEKLVISPRTVNTHLSSIYGKLQVKSRSAATRYAIDHKLV